MSEARRASLNIIGAILMFSGVLISFFRFGQNSNTSSIWAYLLGLLLFVFAAEERTKILEKKLREAKDLA